MGELPGVPGQSPSRANREKGLADAVERPPGEPPRWRIGAVMRSIALKDGRPRRAATDDLGATWRVEPLGE